MISQSASGSREESDVATVAAAVATYEAHSEWVLDVVLAGLSWAAAVPDHHFTAPGMSRLDVWMYF